MITRPLFIKNIVGKLQRSENIWTIYYETISTITNKLEVYSNMQLKRLDTDIWILECGKYANDSSYDTFYDLAD